MVRDLPFDNLLPVLPELLDSVVVLANALLGKCICGGSFTQLFFAVLLHNRTLVEQSTFPDFLKSLLKLRSTSEVDIVDVDRASSDLLETAELLTKSELRSFEL